MKSILVLETERNYFFQYSPSSVDLKCMQVHNKVAYYDKNENKMFRLNLNNGV